MTAIWAYIVLFDKDKLKKTEEKWFPPDVECVYL